MSAGAVTLMGLIDGGRLALGVEEAAAALGMGRKPIDLALKNGQLSAAYPTSRASILIEDLVAWHKTLPREPQ